MIASRSSRNIQPKISSLIPASGAFRDRKIGFFIQLTLNAGRTVDQKRAFYKATADGLHERISLRREDVFICLVVVGKENWSFGSGEAQYTKSATELEPLGAG